MSRKWQMKVNVTKMKTFKLFITLGINIGLYIIVVRLAGRQTIILIFKVIYLGMFFGKP